VEPSQGLAENVPRSACGGRIGLTFAAHFVKRRVPLKSLSGESKLKLLLLLAFAHLVVDTVALAIQPLWPDLRSNLVMSDGEFQAAYLLWNVTNSLLQLPVAYWADRHDVRWLVWAGPVVGAVCVGCVGFANSFLGLCFLLVLGGAGLAAFHPEAAVMAASSLPEDRSRALSVFSMGGILGQAIGPLYAGQLSTAYGMPAISWTIAWAWVALAVVGVGVRRLTRPQVELVSGVTPHGPPMRGTLAPLWVLVAVGILRVAPLAGIPLALAFSIKDSGGSNADVGFIQSVFMAAIGVGSLVCALFARRHNERRVFWLLPLMAAIILLLCPRASGTLLTMLIGLTGLCVGVTLPMLVSFGQQLLPHRQRIASGLMMGVTWAVASPIAAGTIEFFEHLDCPVNSLYAFGAILGASSALCCFLPRNHMKVNQGGTVR
jgi:MFS transporter, FSR family, fosmidomycin resistance protein